MRLINLLHSEIIFITNWRWYFKEGQLYHKVGKALLQSSTAFRNYKVGQELLQNVAVTTIKWGNFILKWDSYYKVGHYIDQSYIKE